MVRTGTETSAPVEQVIKAVQDGRVPLETIKQQHRIYTAQSNGGSTNQNEKFRALVTYMRDFNGTVLQRLEGRKEQ